MTRPDRVSIDTICRTRFRVSELEIDPSLAGRAHVFPFLGSTVTFRLPGTKELPEKWHDDAPIRYRYWKTVAGQDVPLSYHVEEFAAWIGIKNKVSVRSEVLRLPHTQSKLFTREEHEQLTKLVEDHYERLLQAYDYWLRVLRWKTRRGEIGRFRSIRGETGWHGTLCDAKSKHRFFRPALTSIISGANPITVAEWNATAAAVRRGLQPPAWINFLFEGEDRLHVRDLHGAIISLTVASESLIRELFARDAGKKPGRAVVEIMSQVNIRAILNRFHQLGFWSDDWKRRLDRSGLNELFNVRDGIMHRADVAGLDLAECERLAAVVRTFVSLASPHLDRTASP